jgi:hypothetical protein
MRQHVSHSKRLLRAWVTVKTYRGDEWVFTAFAQLSIKQMFLTFRAVGEATVPSNPVYSRQILGSFSRAQAYLWATVGGILHRIAGRAREYSMCNSCHSENQSEFNGEVAIHVPGVKGLDKPVVFAFPKLLVCFYCGFTEFRIPEPELRRLTEGDTAGA